MWPFNRKKKKEVKKEPFVPRARYSMPPPPARVQDDTANHMLNYMIIDSMVNDGHHHKHDSPSQDIPSHDHSHSHDHGSSYDSSSHDSGSSYDSGSSDSSSYDSGSSGDY
jgi:hypothetical protein